MVTTVGASILSVTGSPSSAYGEKDVPIVPVTQYKVSQVSRSSRGNAVSTSPLQSLQLRSFSTIQAAIPAGESASPTARVCGLVACSRAYAPSANCHCRPASR